MDVNARRTELDLPGTLKHELVGYPVVADSPYLRRGITPSWAKLTLVVRDDRVHTPEEAATVREGDHVYFLAPPDRVQALDRFFAERPPQAVGRGRSGRGFLRAGRDHARRARRDLRPGDSAGRRADAARGFLRALFHQARAAAERRHSARAGEARGAYGDQRPRRHGRPAAGGPGAGAAHARSRRRCCWRVGWSGGCGRGCGGRRP